MFVCDECEFCGVEIDVMDFIECYVCDVDCVCDDGDDVYVVVMLFVNFKVRWCE